MDVRRFWVNWSEFCWIFRQRRGGETVRTYINTIRMYSIRTRRRIPLIIIYYTSRARIILCNCVRTDTNSLLTTWHNMVRGSAIAAYNCPTSALQMLLLNTTRRTRTSPSFQRRVFESRVSKTSTNVTWPSKIWPIIMIIIVIIRAVKRIRV